MILIRHSDIHSPAPFPKVNTRKIMTNRPSARLQRTLKAAALANSFRAEYPGHDGGYVTIWRLRPDPGWTSDLSSPNKFRPGCMAISASGQVFVASGGGYWDGAEKWALIYDPAAMKNATNLQ
jgi:hypothetical protein